MTEGREIHVNVKCLYSFHLRLCFLEDNFLEEKMTISFFHVAKAENDISFLFS